MIEIKKLEVTTVDVEGTVDVAPGENMEMLLHRLRNLVNHQH